MREIAGVAAPPVPACNSSHAVVNEVHKGIPVAVNLDTSELKEGLGTFRDPSTAAMIESAAEDVLDCALDHAGTDLEIAPEKLIVVHPLRSAIEEVLTDRVDALASSLVARSGLRDGIATFCELIEDLFDC